MIKEKGKGSAACGMCLQMTGNGEGSGADPIDGFFLFYFILQNFFYLIYSFI